MQGPFLRKYGVAATINFNLYEIDGIDFRTDATVGTADIFLLLDEATEVASDNAATDEGRGYSLVISIADMANKRITGYIEDQSGPKLWLDDSFVIETIRHPLAMHPQGVMAADTAQAGGNSTITLATTASAINDQYLGSRVRIISGTGSPQDRPIVGYVGSTRVATISGTWAVNPDSSSVYEVIYDSVSEITIPTVAQIADAVLDELTAGHTTAGSLSKAIIDVLADTANMQPKLGAPSSDVSADIAAIKTVVDTVLVDTANMQPKLGSPSSDVSADIAAIKTVVDTVLVDTADIQPKIGTPSSDVSADIAVVKATTDSIKTKTDQLGFSSSGNVQADTQEINDGEVFGAGTVGDKWRGSA